MPDAPNLNAALILKGRVMTFNQGPDQYDFWEKGCVVIEGGHISAVGDPAELALPADSATIDYGDHRSTRPLPPPENQVFDQSYKRPPCPDLS